ncbi:MAG: DegQ family serine endoprotease [Betaproteobacteria bacterium]|nr:DegQ family serine endoprotease [Betaproteobacteria bacterium]MDH5221129.1 DegQ family serine endoprotease [Betaproteobacteria bacterium]MDH5350679.1 DegQ family serine endoprotease [Betaproteobacteria bacterium]
MQLIRAAAGLLLGAVTMLATAQVRDLPDFTRLVEEQGAAVVNISTTQSPRRASGPQAPGMEDEEMLEFFRRFIPRQPGPSPRPESRSLGSGFVISADGYILTNAHVVEGADEIDVRLTDKREFKARVIGADKRTDVALIKIEAASLPIVRMGDPSRLKVGEWVVAIGSPFGFENTVTAGIVSAKGRSLPQENFVPFIQTDVAINPGNSGGPLFNMKGEVVGVNSQIYSRTGGFMGLSFAIPIDVALDVQQQLRDKGRVSRGRIGVVIQEVTRDLAVSFGLERARGALVNSVEKGSPADKAGVEATDIILRFDGKEVESSSDLPRIVGATRPGTRVTMDVWRKGAARALNITVGELLEDRVAARETPKERKPGASAANRLGIVVSELTSEQKKERGLEHGLLVTDVKADARAELRRGDILLKLVHNGRHTELRSAEQLNKLLAGMDKGAVITLQVRRGESTAFVTVTGLSDKG